MPTPPPDPRRPQDAFADGGPADVPSSLPIGQEPADGRGSGVGIPHAATSGPTSAGGAFDPRGSHSRPARSLFAQALHDTFGRTGTRIASAWLGLLALLAVFAPFLATSFPLAWRVNGAWEFPVLQSLGPVDVTLLATFLALIVTLLLGRIAGLKAGPAALGILVVTALTAAISFATVRPAEIRVYDTFRVAEIDGTAQRVIRAPVAYSPNDRSGDIPDTILLPPFWGAGEGLSAERVAAKREADVSGGRHWLGTNIYSEDVASRMIHATRIALSVGFIATGIAVIIGVVFGGLMGYFAGWIDLLGMRFIEIVESIPRLIVLLIVMVSFGRNIYLMMLVIGLTSWTGDARFIRAEFLKLRKQDFVQACTAAGLPLWSILFRHMLPNGIAPVLVNVSFGVGQAILLESTLSFLGLGLPPEEASWGQLLDQARSGGTGFSWWIALFPGLAIFLTVFAFILIGEALRDAIDPKLKKAGD